MRHTALMRTSASLYHRHRFPTEIISHCVWLYLRFALSFRDVEEMLAMRGVALSYETVREWCLKFGQSYANALRRKSPRPGDRWRLDEVFLKINFLTDRVNFCSVGPLLFNPSVAIATRDVCTTLTDRRAQ